MSNQPTAREILREIDVAYQNKQIELPRELHGKIANFLATSEKLVAPTDEKIPERRELNEQEKAKGRSPDYWDLSPEDQWAEDKHLGILDWDGNSWDGN